MILWWLSNGGCYFDSSFAITCQIFSILKITDTLKYIACVATYGNLLTVLGPGSVLTATNDSFEISF